MLHFSTNTIKQTAIQHIRTILIEWYFANKRDLPWRDTHDAYKIWISEVILQQTRVNQGYEYYLRFIKRFPNVEELAEADENEVLLYWQGLGYYSRARNLHKASKVIIKQFDGVFPSKYDDIISLPGIGEYSAAAISSFAFNLPYATVDGNVFRVLSRLTNSSIPIDSTEGKKYFTQMAQSLLDKSAPDIHNQAIMEFGALQCTPYPNCAVCPLILQCLAFQQNSVELLPAKKGKTQVRERYFHYFYIEDGTHTYLQKRELKDIWRNLYELPLVETSQAAELSNLLQNDRTNELLSKHFNYTISNNNIYFKHVLSHQIIHANFYLVKVLNCPEIDEYVCVPISELDKYPISRLTELFFRKIYS